MHCQVPVLPPDLVARIYASDLDPNTMFQLSRMCGGCFSLWKRTLVHNVARLLRGHASVSCGYTHVWRELKTVQDVSDSKEISCMTLRMHVPAEALGQFLSLSALDRRAVGNHLIRWLSFCPYNSPDPFHHFSIGILHDAYLKPRDDCTLRDLLWDFPSQAYAQGGLTAAIDAQWWVSSYASPAKHPIAWDCWHLFDAEPVSDRCPACLDSQADFIE